MRILITGYAGFIGSHLVESLIDLGHEVIGIDVWSDYYDLSYKERNHDAVAAKGARCIQADLTSAELYTDLPANIDLIYHCAAQPGLDANVSFRTYLKNNVIATHELCQWACTLPDLRCFVNIATSSIYGSMATRTERELPQPISHYGVTKFAAEQYVLSLQRQGLLRACSIRLYSVYGSRERPDKLFTRLIHSALTNNTFPLYEGSLSHLRSFTHIHDVCEGLTSVLNRVEDCLGQIINMGSETEYSTKDAIEAVESLLHTNIQLEHQPARQGDQQRTKANIHKARQLLGFEPTVTLHQGVQEQIDWMRSMV